MQAIQDAASDLKGRSFVDYIWDFDAQTVDVVFDRGPDDTYTFAQLLAWLDFNRPDIIALLVAATGADPVTADDLEAFLWGNATYWVKADGTPPPEGGWPESERPGRGGR